ncbi:MAG TPA: nucleotidyl transferase AbiEii/AbiGii toxin family protein [Gemmatimonadota bacterium]|nr:nucleotidyl transferase AbiEii/AbiGii toxin family protein [Gemmatimonadota bacterium]
MASRPEPDFGRILGALTRALESRDLPFMVIGGQAVLVHGQPRLTLDIDITLGVEPDRLETVLEICRELDLEPLPEEVEPFVKETFVLPALHRETRIRVDFVFSTTPYERQAIERAVSIEVGGARVPFATAEDLVLHKLFAGRPRDLEDVLGIVRRRGKALDWSYLERWASEFATVPGREGMVDQISRLRAED